MKYLILILSLLAFIQIAVLPFNLVLIVILSRALIKDESANLYLAFAFGLLVSYLSGLSLGILSIIYLILTQLVNILSQKWQLQNLAVVLVIISAALLVNDLITSLIWQSSPQLFPKIIFETVLILPIYIVVKFWEERFTFKSAIKLKF